MKIKGFTLIELLAVIVILAIIALIATPIIIDIIEDSKKEALKRSAENYLKAVELSIAKENLNSEFNPNSCTIEAGITKCDDKTLNVTVDGELPESGEIKLSNGTIDKTSETFLTYKSGTVTYKEGKLTIESPKKELIAEGLIITETTSGIAVNVDNQLVYYVPEGSNEATVIGYRGNIDYSYSYWDSYWGGGDSQTSGDIEIASKVKINDVIYSVTSIGKYAFYNSSDLRSVKIPNSIVSIEEYAFYYCANLSDIIIPTSVTIIKADAFNGCISLSSIIIPESVTILGEAAFSNCSNLTSITIPSSVTEMHSASYYINPFANTPWLTTQRQTSPNGLVIINNILIDGMNATGDVVIPDGVTTINSYVFGSSYGDVAHITSVTIPSSVTSIGYAAFDGHHSLKININKPEASIAGKPWNGYGCTVNWLG